MFLSHAIILDDSILYDSCACNARINDCLCCTQSWLRMLILPCAQNHSAQNHPWKAFWEFWVRQTLLFCLFFDGASAWAKFNSNNATQSLTLPFRMDSIAISLARWLDNINHYRCWTVVSIMTVISALQLNLFIFVPRHFKHALIVNCHSRMINHRLNQYYFQQQNSLQCNRREDKKKSINRSKGA